MSVYAQGGYRQITALKRREGVHTELDNSMTRLRVGISSTYSGVPYCSKCRFQRLLLEVHSSPSEKIV